MPPVDAKTIALLCYGLPIDESTALIEQYASVVASSAVKEAIEQHYEKLIAGLNLDMPLTSSLP